MGELIPHLVNARSNYELSSAYYVALFRYLSRTDDEMNDSDMLYSLNLWEAQDIEVISNIDDKYNKIINGEKKLSTVNGINWAAYYVGLKWRICINRKDFDGAKKVLKAHPELRVFFILSKDDGTTEEWYSDNMKELLLNNEE